MKLNFTVIQRMSEISLRYLFEIPRDFLECEPQTLAVRLDVFCLDGLLDEAVEAVPVPARHERHKELLVLVRL